MSATYTEDSRWFHNNEVPSYSCPLCNGRRHGKEKVSYLNGKPKIERSYLAGRLHGTSKWWDTNGRLIKIIYFLANVQVDIIEFEAYKGVK